MSIGHMSIEAIQLSGERTQVTEEMLADLRGALFGPVLTDGDPGYDEARIIFNAAYDCRPAMIAMCRGTSDVVEAVNFARKHSLLTAIRGGGHGIPGYATCEDGLVIDLTMMNAVLVDGDQRIARAQGGALLGDLDRETQVAGLVVPAGVVSITGVGGLTLGGGLGWLHRKYGLSCDNLRSLEVVLADGSVVRASPTQHQDLFWALQGGGGNFGVVTEFEFDAHPLGPMILLAATAYPLEEARDVLTNWRDWTATIPEEVTSRVIMFTPPDHPSVPRVLLDRDGMLIGAVYAGPVEEGESILEPVRHLGTPLVDMGGPMTFRALQSMLDLVGLGELGGYWKSTYIDEMTDDFIDVVVKRANSRPTPQTVSQLITMGGAVSKLGPTDTAFGYRAAPYMLSAESVWYDPKYGEACTTWAREFISEADALGLAKGTYLNFNGESDLDSRTAQFGENLARLSAVKREYDPGNLFRRNNNIAPS
jgi:FAD/FMN-containing dehydrogenase